MPKKQKTFHEVDDTHSGVSKHTNEASIHKLNDDCLHKIFMELPIKDRIRIERVCKRWQNVSQQAWPDVKNLELTRYAKNCTVEFVDSSKHNRRYFQMSIRTVEKILSCCGRFLTQLKVCSIFNTADNRQDLSLIRKHCYNVRKLILDLANYPNDELKQIVSRCQKLKYVEISNLGKEFTGDCFHKLSKETISEIHLNMAGSANNENFFPLFAAEVIRNLNNLRALHLKRFVFKPEALKPISENQILTNVCFDYCSFHQSISLVANLRNLERLSLCSVSDVCDEFLSYLTRNCTQLNYLDISYCNAVSDQGMVEIAKLPRIESLLIECLTRVSDINLGRIATLKTLECSECDGICDSGIVALIENAPSLEYLGLFDTSVTEVTLEAAHRVTLRRKNGLELKIRVNNSLMQDYEEPEEISPLLNIEVAGADDDYDTYDPHYENLGYEDYYDPEVYYDYDSYDEDYDDIY